MSFGGDDQPHWLLEVEVEGRVYRWSDVAVEVETEDGEVLWYSGGLADLSLAQGSEPQVAVADASVDWAVVGPLLDGSRCTLRRWAGGTWETAEVYARGDAVAAAWGGRTEAASWTVALAAGPLRGTQVPDALAQVDGTTWPITGSHTAGDAGGVYPVVLGYPGYISAAVASHQVVPLPIAQWQDGTAATTYVVVAEDPDFAITGVRVRNDDLDASAVLDTAVVTDLLGRRVVVAEFTAETGILPASEQASMFGGYRPTTGGGPRDAYSVVAYLLRRWGPQSVDWARLPEVADVLGAYAVDTWIDDPLADPWVWIEDVLLPDLPLVVRTSERGRYLVSRHFGSQPQRRVGAIEVGGAAVERTGQVRREGPPLNEFRASYRRSRAGEWLARAILTGASELVARVPGVGRPATVAESGACVASVARWGVRPAEPMEIDWTWDSTTVDRVLSDQALRWALPAYMVDLELRGPSAEVREGDEVLLTDDELGWSDRPAVVDAPPVRGATLTRATFRVFP